MCTSLVVNRKKTIVGWNLDILEMTSRVRAAADGVFLDNRKQMRNSVCRTNCP